MKPYRLEHSESEEPVEVILTDTPAGILVELRCNGPLSEDDARTIATEAILAYWEGVKDGSRIDVFVDHAPINPSLN